MKLTSLLITFIISSLTISDCLSQLPEEWLGSYEGELEITNLKGETNNVQMGLLIEQKSDTSYSFSITYKNDSTEQVRPYELIYDKGNRFVMDEKNGILLPIVLFDNRLISTFEVQGSLLQVSYTLEKNHIYFRTTSSREYQKSGGRDEVPEVQGYLPVVDQKGVLIKQNH